MQASGNNSQESASFNNLSSDVSDGSRSGAQAPKGMISINVWTL